MNYSSYNKKKIKYFNMTTMTTIMHLYIAYLCNEKFPVFTCQVQFGFWLQELVDVKQGFGKMLFCV